MEDNKKISGKLLPPSLFILLVITSTIIITYSYYLETNNYMTGFIILAAALILLPFIYKKTIPGNKIQFMILIFLTTAVSFYTYNKIASILINIKNSKIILIGQDETKIYYTGLVKKIKIKRYNRELLINFYVKDKDTNDTHSLNSGIALAYLNDDLDIKTGDKIVFNSKVKKIDINKKSMSPYSIYLLQRGISFTTYLNKENTAVIKRSTQSIKYNVSISINKKIGMLFSAESGALLRALYFGNKNFISKKTINNFKKAGVLHILAASGLHVGIIASVPLFLLGLLRINRKFILTITFAIILFYLYITDMPVSLLRASVMFGIFSLQYIFALDRNIFNVLYLTAVIILLLFPYELQNMGFQLSFGATMGILLFFKKYKNSLPLFPKPFTNSMAITLSAQIIVIPVIIYHMNEINLTGIFSNLFIIPLTGLLLISSFAANLFSFFHIVPGKVMGQATDFIYVLINYIIDILASLKGHFNIEKAGLLMYLSFFLIFIPIQLKSVRKEVKSIAIVSAYIICWMSLISLNKDKVNDIIIFNHTKGKTILLIIDKKASIIGDLPVINETGPLLNRIDRLDIKKLDLYIIRPDFINITSCLYIIKKKIVNKCVLSYDFKLKTYMKEFFKILKKDKITLDIYDFKNLKYITGREHDKKNTQFQDLNKKVIALYNKYIKPSKLSKNIEFSKSQGLYNHTNQPIF